MLGTPPLGHQGARGRRGRAPSQPRPRQSPLLDDRQCSVCASEIWPWYSAGPQPDLFALLPHKKSPFRTFFGLFIFFDEKKVGSRSVGMYERQLSDDPENGFGCDRGRPGGYWPRLGTFWGACLPGHTFDFRHATPRGLRWRRTLGVPGYLGPHRGAYPGVGSAQSRARLDLRRPPHEGRPGRCISACSGCCWALLPGTRRALNPPPGGTSVH